MYRIKNRNTNKIDILLKQPRQLFHTEDLALLWEITNRNTIYTTIKRYVKKGVLVRLHKGFYSTINPKSLDSVELGLSYLHQYAYLSTETVLVQEGIINQVIPHTTLVTSVSKKFSIAEHTFLARQLKDKYLYQTFGINQVGNIRTATMERAIADLLYFNPRYYFDNRQLVDWAKVKAVQKKVGYK